tara:strand:- start:130 stop:561 length:432 start_codon:yes stop_codon:yes gene_type:complete
MSLFKSKEQRAKDRKKKELKKQISAIGTGGGRGNQATKKRLQRELANIDKVVKKKTPRVSGAQANKRKNYGNNQDKYREETSNNSGKKTSATKSGKTKAQLLYQKNKKKYGGTGSAAKANVEAMRLKIRKRYLESQKKKKKNK